MRPHTGIRLNMKILLFYAQKGRCAYCHSRIHVHESTLDHVKPISKGGGWKYTNLVCACWTCNNRKGAMDAKKFGAVIGKPRLIPKPAIMARGLAA